MKVGSLFSGIGAPELAWSGFGWDFRWCAEIEPFASAVYAERFPGVPNLGDVTKVDWDAVEPVDVLVAGSPCQSFSIAGKRLGLADPRGNLALLTLSVARRLAARWLVFENVPGLLSRDGGRDFGAFLGLLGECGYGWAYRVLDAQYLGVAQRRERVFVVGCLGDWRRAAEVLFEPDCLSGHPAPRREAGQAAARPVASGSPRGSGYRNDADTADNLIAAEIAPPVTSNPYGDHESREGLLVAGTVTTRSGNGSRQAGANSNLIAGTLQANGKAAGSATQQDAEAGMLIAHTLRGEGFDASEDGTGRGTPLTVALRGRAGGNMAELGSDVGNAVRSAQGGSSKSHALTRGTVRRLTPRETERLQGMPDDFTLITYRGKPAADGNRYRAIGNSMAVPVLAWIGARIKAVSTPTLMRA